MIPYCTLAEAKAELKADSTIGDDQLMRYINQVSRRIDLMMAGRSTRPYFAPYIEARQVPIDGRRIDSNRGTLLLRGVPPLMAFSAVTADGSTVTSTVEGYPSGVSPIQMLRMTSAGCSWQSYISGCDPAYAEISGTWGYHSDYANAWLGLDTLVGNLNASASTFTVNDVDGDDPYGFAPRISRGTLLKLDDEFVLVTDTNTSTNVVTVRRGYAGSTAAAHTTGITIYGWQVEEPIKRVTQRQAALLYARQGAFQVETVEGIGSISYPQDLLKEMAQTIQEYRNLV